MAVKKSNTSIEVYKCHTKGKPDLVKSLVNLADQSKAALLEHTILDFVIHSMPGDQQLAERERVIVGTSDFRVMMYSIEPLATMIEMKVESSIW